MNIYDYPKTQEWTMNQPLLTGRGFSCVLMICPWSSPRWRFFPHHIWQGQYKPKPRLLLFPLSPPLCSWISEKFSPCWMPFPIPLEEMGLGAASISGHSNGQSVASKLLRACWWEGDTEISVSSQFLFWSKKITISTFYDWCNSWIPRYEEPMINHLNICGHCCITNAIWLGLTEEKPLEGKKSCHWEFPAF